ncbi:hypothetical protein [Parafrigoribacterium humi]
MRDRIAMDEAHDAAHPAIQPPRSSPANPSPISGWTDAVRR